MSDVKLKPYVKCPSCGTWIMVPPATKPAESSAPNEAGASPTFELRDSKGGGRMTFAWRNLARSSPDGSSVKPGLDITLEFPGTTQDFPSQIKAAAGLVTDISKPLLRFFEELAALEGDWSEERRLRDPDRQFSITCWSCYKGEVGFDVSLAAEFQCPAWTVELSLYVKQSDLSQIVGNLRRFLAAARQ